MRYRFLTEIIDPNNLKTTTKLSIEFVFKYPGTKIHFRLKIINLNLKILRMKFNLTIILIILISNLALSQNVGIGTTTPVSKLNVEGTGTNTELLRLSNDKDVIKDSILILTAGGKMGVGTTNPIGKLHVFGGDSYLWGLNLGFGTTVANISTDHPTKPMIFNQGSNERLRIDTGGKVGIGTSTPSSTLSVNGNADFVGNVGIGFSSPSSKIHVHDVLGTQNAPSSDLILSRHWTSNTDTRASSIFHYYSTSTYRDNLAFAVSGDGGSHNVPNSLSQIKMIVQADGNVGIGTLTPSNKLSVNGNSDFNGNVGIGTNSPHISAALDVTSTTQGFLPPRMTLAQRNAITSPEEGLMISCTDCTVKGLHQYINGAWQAMTSSNTGNYGTVVNPVTGKVWLDRNLGATQVATSSTDAASYGDLYQWGRNADGHQIRTSGTTSTLADNFFTINGLFITNSSSQPNWLSNIQTHMWSGSDAENNPCPSGFRIPTAAEWEQERRTWSSNAAGSPLKLPLAGSRLSNDGSVNSAGNAGIYWSSTVSGAQTRIIYVDNSNSFMAIFNRAPGYSVRCIKD